MNKQFVPSFFSQDVFKDFDKFFVGFDDQLGKMQKFHDEIAKNIPNYPPYNIKKTGDNSYTIELAVAGFGQTDIDIELADGKLIVRGNASNESDDSENFLFKGIANRAFTRAFALNDEVVVNDAEIVNGMLKVALDKLAEVSTVKKIEVKGGKKSKKEFLAEEAAE